MFVYVSISFSFIIVIVDVVVVKLLIYFTSSNRRMEINVASFAEKKSSVERQRHVR